MQIIFYYIKRQRRLKHASSNPVYSICGIFLLLYIINYFLANLIARLTRGISNSEMFKRWPTVIPNIAKSCIFRVTQDSEYKGK